MFLGATCLFHAPVTHESLPGPVQALILNQTGHLDNSDLKGGIAVLGIDWEIIRREERYFFIWCLCTKDITQGDVLKPFRLTDVIKVRNVDTAIVSQK